MHLPVHDLPIRRDEGEQAPAADHDDLVLGAGHEHVELVQIVNEFLRGHPQAMLHHFSR